MRDEEAKQLDAGESYQLHNRGSERNAATEEVKGMLQDQLATFTHVSMRRLDSFVR